RTGIPNTVVAGKASVRGGSGVVVGIPVGDGTVPGTDASTSDDEVDGDPHEQIRHSRNSGPALFTPSWT
ncbi:MAG: hypothetical protein ABIQ39_05710, partial [Ilumatobacteraceae bacterium]